MAAPCPTGSVGLADFIVKGLTKIEPNYPNDGFWPQWILGRVKRAYHTTCTFVCGLDDAAVSCSCIRLDIIDTPLEHLVGDFEPFDWVLERTGESRRYLGVQINRMHAGFQGVEVCIQGQNANPGDEADLV